MVKKYKISSVKDFSVSYMGYKFLPVEHSLVDMTNIMLQNKLTVLDISKLDDKTITVKVRGKKSNITNFEIAFLTKLGRYFNLERKNE